VGLAVIVTTGVAYGGTGGNGIDSPGSVPELGSASALTALALLGGTSLIWTNRRK
jgi:hypothetical protein